MEGTCAVCYYRIYAGQDAAVMRVGSTFRPVHRHHADEGKISIRVVRRNVIEVVEDEVVNFL